MKKFFTILALVLTVAFCASFVVNADTLTALDTNITKEVTLVYDATTEDTTTVVYSVDVAWTDVSFSYNAGKTQWNPSTHDYDADGVAATWGDYAGSVTVTNHSNAAVAVSVTFEKAATANGTADVAVTDGSFNLDTAVGTDFGEAPANTATLTASGKPTSDASIGTVKVAITAPAVLG